MPRPPSLNRVIILGQVLKTRIGTNQHGQRYFTFTLATVRWADVDGERGVDRDMHYITIFGDANVKRAAREIKYKANVMIEGFLRYLDKRDPETKRIVQRYTYIQADYWQVAREGEDKEHEEHRSVFRASADPGGLARVDRVRDSIVERKEHEGH